jgi:hypothetical protein
MRPRGIKSYTQSPSSRSLLLSLLDRLNDLIHDTGITQRRRITQTVLLPAQHLPQNTAHNLPRPRLGQIVDDEDRLGCRKGTDLFPDLQHEVLAGLLAGIGAILERDEGVDRLARQLVIDAHDGGLGDAAVLDEGRLNLRGGEAVAGHVDDVVDATADPVEAVLVAGGAVAGEL